MVYDPETKITLLNCGLSTNEYTVHNVEWLTQCQSIIVKGNTSKDEC